MTMNDGPDTAAREDQPTAVFHAPVDWGFLSHRLNLATRLLAGGYRVVLLAGSTGRDAELKEHGIEFLPLPISRQGFSPIPDLRHFVLLVSAFRRLRPALIHNISTKPIIYGSLAARFVPGSAVVNAVTGMGFPFTRHPVALLIRPIVMALYLPALRRRKTATVFQNQEDLEKFVGLHLLRRRDAFLIAGTGLDLTKFAYAPESDRKPVVVLAARMLRNKGVYEFAQAARMLKDEGETASFRLVGPLDLESRYAITAEEMEHICRDYPVEWSGPSHDMPATYRESALVVLPSTHPEGTPRALIEAAAIGRAIVTTDVPGCRDVVKPGINGLLVRPGDVPSLKEAIATLLRSPERRRAMGLEGTAIAEQFSEAKWLETAVVPYRKLLGDRA